MQKFLTDDVHYPDLGSASDWLCRDGFFFQSIRSTTKILVVHVISLEFLRSLLRRRFARAQVATLRNVGCFLRLAKQWFDGQFEADSRSATLHTLNFLKQHCN